MRTNNVFDKHTIDILRAAMPHVHPSAQGGMNVLLKANDLMSTIESRGQDDEVSTMDIGSWTPEPEEMLLSIKEVANPGEVEMVDTVLNFLKARKLFNAYQTYNETVMEAQGLGGANRNFRRNPFNIFNLFSGMPNMMNQRNNQNRNANAGNQKMNAAGTANNTAAQNNGQMPSFMNFLMSQLSPEQKQTFDMLNMMMNNMPNGSSGNVSGQNIRNDQDKNMKSQSINNETNGTEKKDSES